MNLSFLMEKRHSYFISMILLWTSFSLVSQSSCAQNQEKIICNGIPWFDDQGKIVNAHGACIVVFSTSLFVSIEATLLYS